MLVVCNGCKDGSQIKIGHNMKWGFARPIRANGAHPSFLTMQQLCGATPMVIDKRDVYVRFKVQMYVAWIDEKIMTEYIKSRPPLSDTISR